MENHEDTKERRMHEGIPSSCFLRLFVPSWLFFCLAAAPIDHFDGRTWNVSTGNLSVTFIQHSPIGAHPQANYYEPLPSLDSQKLMKSHGLVANEDYIAWGAVEREPGKWDWS